MSRIQRKLLNLERNLEREKFRERVNSFPREKINHRKGTGRNYYIQWQDRSQHAIAVLPYAAHFPWREAGENPSQAFPSLFSCHFRELLFSVKLLGNILIQEKGGSRKCWQ